MIDPARGNFRIEDMARRTPRISPHDREARALGSRQCMELPGSMTDDLIFMMGTFEARFPTERRYTRNHLWLQPTLDRPEVMRVGFTAYSVRLLRDVYFLDWSLSAPAAVASRQEIGQIESSKAVSSLYAPADGTIVAYNQELLADPSAINVDGYGAGWLFEWQAEDRGLTAEEYLAHVTGGWDLTQRLLKKQVTADERNP